jgi:Fe2+ transport system protein FeoA
MKTSFEQITDKKSLAELQSGEDGVVTKLRGDAGTLGIFRHLGIVLDAPVVRVMASEGAPDDYDIHVMIDDRLVSLNKQLAHNVRVSVERLRATVDVNRVMEQRRLAMMVSAR